MDDVESGGRFRAVLRTIGTAAAGLAVTLLLWAGCLALWSRYVAPRAPQDGDWPSFIHHVHRFGNAMPAGLVITIWVTAIGLLVAAAVSRWQNRRGSHRAVDIMAWSAIVALGVYGFLSFGIPAFYRRVTDGYPVTSSIPGVVAAWLLGVGGTVAVLLAAPQIPRLSRSSRPVLAVGAVVGVLLASIVTIAAARAGDDGRFADATTATTVDLPPAPTGFGQRRFTVSEPNGYDRNSLSVSVAAAGAGFVVYNNGKVTAYGADGAERWHYARTGQDRVRLDGIEVFDEGATMLLSVRGIENSVIALDALTGTKLWVGGRTKSERAAFLPFDPYPTPYAIARSDGEWSRYDTRTGRVMWTVPAPRQGCEVEAADTVTRLAVVATCEHDGTATAWVTTLDPSSGAVLWEAPVQQNVPKNQYGLYSEPRVVSPANDVGFFVSRSGGTDVYVNVGDETMTDLPPEVRPSITAGPGDDFVGVEGFDDAQRMTLFGARGNVRCTAADSPIGYTRLHGVGGDHAAMTFGDTFVVIDHRRRALSVRDSATCDEVARSPADAVEGFVSAPGVNLVLRMGENGTLEIDGYR